MVIGVLEIQPAPVYLPSTGSPNFTVQLYGPGSTVIVPAPVVDFFSIGFVDTDFPADSTEARTRVGVKVTCTHGGSPPSASTCRWN